MSKSVVAKRYALALFRLAQGHGQTKSVQEDLLVLEKVYREHPELGQLLDNPRLSMSNKKELLTNSFKGVNPLILNTLFVLLERQRMNEVLNLVDDFIELADETAGVASAKVFSTRPLTEDESAAISSTFAKKVGRQSLRIEKIIDPTLIGGIRLQIGNQIFDSSLSAKLEQLKRELIGS